jgi:hypothetical protein
MLIEASTTKGSLKYWFFFSKRIGHALDDFLVSLGLQEEQEVNQQPEEHKDEVSQEARVSPEPGSSSKATQ